MTYGQCHEATCWLLTRVFVYVTCNSPHLEVGAVVDTRWQQ